MFSGGSSKNSQKKPEGGNKKADNQYEEIKKIHEST